MYSNHINVNILTALLVEHGVRHAVVCPGSRNAPIVHNLNECPDISCYPVTDERSAGFYALGMSLCLDEPVVVCVTSGTALLNLLPAVAEAYYQQARLIVVSADRPQQWIDQLDGQTLPQPGALGRFVGKVVSLPEVSVGDEETHWYCNRLVNEALLERHVPVHINVPISEPLFEFSVECLPQERKIELLESDGNNHIRQTIEARIGQSQRPMVVIGQLHKDSLQEHEIGALQSNGLLVVCESLAVEYCANHVDEVIYMIGDDEAYAPDFVLYLGRTVVSKRLKTFLRKSEAEVWHVNADGCVQDVFGHLTKVIACPEGQLGSVLPRVSVPPAFSSLWMDMEKRAVQKSRDYVPAYSQMAAVKCFESCLDQAPQSQVPPLNNSYFHYANSTAIRLANIYACYGHYVYCNRGVNGIEGSLSTAAGFSLVTDEKVFCVIGDLSFFYDQNSLWNQNLRGNLRILLLNNGKGGIFNQLNGLEKSPARDRLVAGQHATTAEGICRQNNVNYASAHNEAEMQQGINQLLTAESPRPMLLEVFTDPEVDAVTMKDYYRYLKG